jgi:SHAQKYF class myb-like DNA-binding protein
VKRVRGGGGSDEDAAYAAGAGGAAAADDDAGGAKRPRLVWTPQLHKRFVDAVSHLGIKCAVPKTIMQARAPRTRSCRGPALGAQPLRRPPHGDRPRGGPAKRPLARTPACARAASLPASACAAHARLLARIARANAGVWRAACARAGWSTLLDASIPSNRNARTLTHARPRS